MVMKIEKFHLRIINRNPASSRINDTVILTGEMYPTPDLGFDPVDEEWLQDVILDLDLLFDHSLVLVFGFRIVGDEKRVFRRSHNFITKQIFFIFLFILLFSSTRFPIFRRSYSYILESNV